jgi:hypothetical protein
MTVPKWQCRKESGGVGQTVRHNIVSNGDLKDAVARLDLFFGQRHGPRQTKIQKSQKS